MTKWVDMGRLNKCILGLTLISLQVTFLSSEFVTCAASSSGTRLLSLEGTSLKDEGKALALVKCLQFLISLA